MPLHHCRASPQMQNHHGPSFLDDPCCPNKLVPCNFSCSRSPGAVMPSGFCGSGRLLCTMLMALTKTLCGCRPVDVPRWQWSHSKHTVACDFHPAEPHAEAGHLAGSASKVPGLSIAPKYLHGDFRWRPSDSAASTKHSWRCASANAGGIGTLRRWRTRCSIGVTM